MRERQIRLLLFAGILGAAACSSPPPAKPSPPVAPIPPVASARGTTSTALEAITIDTVGRLERVRGYGKKVARVELLRDGTTLVDRGDELELVDQKEKTLARLPGDGTSSTAWAISVDGLEIAVVRLLPQWSGIVVYKTNGAESGRYAFPEATPSSEILSLTRDRVVLGDGGKSLVFIERLKGTVTEKIALTGPVQFDKDGSALVIDRGEGTAEVKALATGRPSGIVRYPKRTEPRGMEHAGVLSLSDDGRTLIAGESSGADIIDLASKKSTKLAATLLGDVWGRADKIAVLGKGVGLVDRAAPSKIEWKKLASFPCKGKKTCDERDVKWDDLRFTAASPEWPTLFGTAARSMVIWYPGKRVRVLSPDDHDFDSVVFARDGRHVIEFEEGAARVARVLKVPEPDADAPTQHWPVVVPTEPDVTRGTFSADGKLVALWNDRTWKVWNLDSGRLVAMNAKAKIHVPSGAPITPNDFEDPLVREMFLGSEAQVVARQGNLVVRVVETKDKARNIVSNTAAELFDVRSETVVWKGNVPAFTRVWAIEEGGKRVATSMQASQSGYLVFDVAKQATTPTDVPTGSWVFDLAFFGSRIVSTTNRREVAGVKDGARWTASDPCTANKESPEIGSAANGSRVVVGIGKRCIFDVESGAFIAEVGTGESGELARISPDTTELYAHGHGELLRWDATTGKPLPSVKVALVDGRGKSRRPFAYTSDEIIVAATDAIVSFNRKTGAEIARTKWPGAMSVAIAPGKEKLLAVTDAVGRGAIVDRSGAERARFFCPNQHGELTVPAWSVDGRSLYCMKTDYYGKPLGAGAVFVVPTQRAR